jgi:hypothetical protein
VPGRMGGPGRSGPSVCVMLKTGTAVNPVTIVRLALLPSPAPFPPGTCDTVQEPRNRDGGTPSAVIAGPDGPLGAVAARRPDPARVAQPAAPRSVTGSGAFNARMITQIMDKVWS